MRTLGLYLVMALPALCLSSMWEPTPRALRILAGLRNSWRREGLIDKQAADVMGVPHTLLARQLIGRDGTHLSLGRAGELPDVVLVNFAETICDMVENKDAQARLLRDSKLDALMRKLETLEPQALLMPAAERKRA